jgi:hypothetical protein
VGYGFEVSERSLGKHDDKQRIASGIPECETFRASR